MRKILYCLLAVLMLAVFLLCGCTGYSSSKRVERGSISYFVSDLGTRAFPSEYYWDGDPNHTRIEIPDELDGASITSVGGYYGTGNPIGMELLSRDTFTNEELVMPEGTQPEYITFTLVIGKKVKTVVGFYCRYEYFPVRTENGSIRYYIPLIQVECDEENPTFYEKGGKLYRSEDDSLVDRIGYGSPPIDFKIGTLRVYGTMAYSTEYEWVKTSDGAILTKYEGGWEYNDDISREDCIVAQNEGGLDLYREICAALRKSSVIDWDGFHESDPMVLDGGGFSFSMELENGGSISASGSNAYPSGYGEFYSALEALLPNDNEI